jgi:hypothetical protein
MTRKDYVIIASVLYEQFIAARSVNEVELVSLAIKEFSVKLKADNSKFNKEKFIDACTGAK